MSNQSAGGGWCPQKLGWLAGRSGKSAEDLSAAAGGAGSKAAISSAASHIDAAQWDVDCEATFEVALPPRWEFRDRAWSSPGVWRAFPEAVSTEINALARRGQRHGTIKMGDRELVVDLQDNVAVPTDRHAVPRMLRKSIRQPQVNKKALMQFYCRYSEELPPAPGQRGGDGIAGQSFVALFKDLGVDVSSDVAALALAAACNAAEMGVFRRREFIRGCAVLEADNLDDLRKKMPEIRDAVLTGPMLGEVYAYTFGIAIEPPSKVLPLEEAKEYWALLLYKWPLREAFCDWAKRYMKGGAINRDLWMMVLKLATEVPADLSTYDDNPAWPVVLDEFVEHYRTVCTEKCL